MVEFLKTVADFIAPFLQNSVKKQFNYLCCLKTNLQDLQEADNDLEDKKADLMERVYGAVRNEEQILREVATWLTNAGEKRKNNGQILGTPIPGILSLNSRYSLSRRAKKAAKSMVELRASTTKFGRVSNPPLPAAMVKMDPPSGAREIASRKQTEDDIIKAMRDGNVNVIGLWGMGGVGKTIMAKRIMYRAQGEGLFDEVIKVVVGRQADMLKIQQGMAEWLKVKFDVETLEIRANLLKNRLMKGERKLVVIDDVWKRIDLKDLGIPGSCVVLLTSRIRDVFHQMDAMIFIVNKLDEDEAWLMFNKNVGALTNNLHPTAKEVVNECKGLPLAIVTVARALKGKVSLSILKDALNQLKSRNPMGMPDVINKVYNPIKWSYDFLEDQHAKSLLFLCSCFPEDYNISIQEDLLYYSFGLGMFDGINNLEDARNRIASLIETLKSGFLISDGDYGNHVRMHDVQTKTLKSGLLVSDGDYGHVRMHDVVRDVTISIALEEKHAILQFISMDCWSRKRIHSEVCTMLSVVPVERVTGLPMEMSFPNLHFLWMDDSRFKEIHLSDYFFKGMPPLKVLYMKSFSFVSLPQTIQLLKNLHTLHLDSCKSLETLSIVGELWNLEIFICRYCDSIKELPMEIGRLERLRLLEFTYCYNLKTIMPGVILKLRQLEVLKMIHSFKEWESAKKGNQRRNVSLLELGSLTNLSCLTIEIQDGSLAEEELQLSYKIIKYDIRVGEGMYLPNHKKLCINLATETALSLGSWIRLFARSAESLFLKGGAFKGLEFAVYTQNKKYIKLINCPSIEKFGVLPVLEDLILESLPNLEHIFYGQIPGKIHGVEFCNLSQIHVSDCGKLRSLFSSSILISSLSQLQTLTIINCDSIVEVFFTEEGEIHEITFPKLERLYLCNLQKLTEFCKGSIDINIEFPRLVDIEIEKCPRLISFINDALDQNLFCDQKHVTFDRLKKLAICGYQKEGYLWCKHISSPFFVGLETLSISECVSINSLFSYPIAQNLVNLKTLIIEECVEMVYVISDDCLPDDITETIPQIIFHKLEVLVLLSLPKLQSFCKGKWDVQFPLVKQVDVQDCPLVVHDFPIVGSLIKISIRGRGHSSDSSKNTNPAQTPSDPSTSRWMSTSPDSRPLVYVVAGNQLFSENIKMLLDIYKDLIEKDLSPDGWTYECVPESMRQTWWDAFVGRCRLDASRDNEIAVKKAFFVAMEEFYENLLNEYKQTYRQRGERPPHIAEAVWDAWKTKWTKTDINAKAKVVDVGMGMSEVSRSNIQYSLDISRAFQNEYQRRMDAYGINQASSSQHDAKRITELELQIKELQEQYAQASVEAKGEMEAQVKAAVAAALEAFTQSQQP